MRCVYIMYLTIPAALAAGLVSSSVTSDPSATVWLAASVLNNGTTTTTTTTKHHPQQQHGELGNASHLDPWYRDLMNLPADVAFPGSGWLDRMAVNDAGMFWHENRAYSSVFAALVDPDNIQHAQHLPCRNMNAYLNSIVFTNAMAAVVVQLCGNNLTVAHFVMSYLRDLLLGLVVYFGTAGIFHYGIYVHPSMSRSIFEDTGRVRPSAKIMWNQIRLATASLLLYVFLPVTDEFLIESNLTAAYYTFEDVGGFVNYLALLVLYFVLVEIGIYWMHRTLHTNKFLYKHVHLLHHQYKTPEMLTPWASIAFHPLDGIMQASPYLFVIFVVPCHYLTHVILYFLTAVWATYIHDSMDWNVWPVMGSKYHTVHHTHYIYNYGQVFVFCDQFWGSLREPTGPTGLPPSKAKAQ